MRLFVATQSAWNERRLISNHHLHKVNTELPLIVHLNKTKIKVKVSETENI